MSPAKRLSRQRSEALVYERGLRRGLAIAREHEHPQWCHLDSATNWTAAMAQMEREIEEAKR